MTLVHPKVEPPSTGERDAEALIQEARRLRRRRWTLGIIVTVILVGTGVGLGVGLSAGSPATGRQSKTAPPGTLESSAAPGVVPKAPDALAVASNGDLYVVDSGRDQILRRFANGKFEVVAGTGTRGFSGDGGPAVDAKLDLDLGASSGIAVASNGTVYFSDSGNDRVRAVLENGEIETVAGGGTQALPTRPGEPVPARRVSLGSPAGLTFGPDGGLYIAAHFVVRLTPAGQLAWEAGTNQSGTPSCNSTTCLLEEQNFNNAGGLAFDGDGDLVVTSGGFPGAGFGIGEIRSNDNLVDLGACRGEGGKPGALSSAPNGSVICAAQTGLFRIPNGSASQTLIPASEALATVLGSGPWPFLGGDGITVRSNSDIYVDTSPNATATPYAILELVPSGAARVLWKS
jgi:hypothetical protein